MSTITTITMLPTKCHAHRCSVLLVSYRFARTSLKIRPLAGHGWIQICGQHSSSALNGKFAKTEARPPPTPNLVSTLQNNMDWLNQRYERVFGIQEIRDMQSKVLEAERNFVEVTNRRKSCQDKIESLKSEIKSIRDKLDITPRQSDNYLRLITEEHKLLREQLAMDVQLDQLKENEQYALDIMSKLLRQSHELERIRHERSKYWQIISISLSLAGSLVALIAQRARSQKTVLSRLTSIEEKLVGLEDSLTSQKLDFELIAGRMEQLDDRLERMAVILDRRVGAEAKRETRFGQKAQTWSSWLSSLIPGRSVFKSLSGYLW